MDWCECRKGHILFRARVFCVVLLNEKELTEYQNTLLPLSPYLTLDLDMLYLCACESSVNTWIFACCYLIPRSPEFLFENLIILIFPELENMQKQFRAVGFTSSSKVEAVALLDILNLIET